MSLIGSLLANKYILMAFMLMFVLLYTNIVSKYLIGLDRRKGWKIEIYILNLYYIIAIIPGQVLLFNLPYKIYQTFGAKTLHSWDVLGLIYLLQFIIIAKIAEHIRVKRMRLAKMDAETKKKYNSYIDKLIKGVFYLYVLLIARFLIPGVAQNNYYIDKSLDSIGEEVVVEGRNYKNNTTDSKTNNKSNKEAEPTTKDTNKDTKDTKPVEKNKKDTTKDTKTTDNTTKPVDKDTKPDTKDNKELQNKGKEETLSQISNPGGN